MENFDNFPRPNFPRNLYFTTMTGYEDTIPTHIIFPPKRITDTLSSAVSKANLHQLHISETEKFMHTTYFFNGGVEQPHPGEDFFNVPSPKVFDYTNTPEMSAEITKDEVIYRIANMAQKKYSFIVINFANPDMLGHTGNLQSAIAANEITDRCVRDITIKALDAGGAVCITADHGNCETMIDRVTKKIDTAHTNNPVPFILLSDPSQVTSERTGKLLKIGTGEKAQPTGILADIAPTVLGILGVPAPASMTGINLLTVL
jgi:2,3-bisphosphoglycerate-independent phosphoglycerate mutase